MLVHDKEMGITALKISSEVQIMFSEVQAVYHTLRWEYGLVF